MLPSAPEPLKYPRAPLRGVLNILQRFHPHPHPGERKESSPRAGYIKMIAHPVDQSKSLASFLQTLWSRLPGDPAILAFLQPGLKLSEKEQNCKPQRYTSSKLVTRDASASKNSGHRHDPYFRLWKRDRRFWSDYSQTKPGAWIPRWMMIIE